MTVTETINISSPPIAPTSRPLRARSGRYRAERPQPAPGEPRALTYGAAWLGASALGATLSLLGVQRYGLRALAGLGAAGLMGLAYTTLVEPARPRLECLTVRLPNLPPALDGLRIGQIADPHLGMPHAARNLTWAVEQMRREQPELLALTGDFVSHYRALPDLAPLLRDLHAPLGVYAVPGNHDYWEGLDDLQGILDTHDIRLMLNEHRRLVWRGTEFYLAGVDDIWEGQSDLERALDGIPDGAFTVLLCHAPDAADEAARRGVALQLSGHTHGGHVRLPLLGPAAMPHLGAMYMMGRYDIGAMVLYVSRGLSGLPLRLFCPPEATILTLSRG